MKKGFWCNIGMHDYKKVASRTGRLTTTPILFGRETKVDVVIMLERCECCGEFRAWRIELDNREFIDIEYLKGTTREFDSEFYGVQGSMVNPNFVKEEMK